MDPATRAQPAAREFEPGFAPNDREIAGPDRRRRIAIDDPQASSKRSPKVSLPRTPSQRSVRRSRSRHHTHRHHHHYGCGHYGYGYIPFGYSTYVPYYGYRVGYRYDPYRYDSYGYGHDSGYRRNNAEAPVYGGSGGGAEVAMGALDLDIEPQQAEIFVDGYLIGDADQFDGFPNYLWLEEGTYELAFFREGYETIYRQYTIYPGVIIDVDDRMRPGQAERPEPPSVPSAEGGAQLPDPSSDQNIGRIVIAGSPADAAVYLDGHFVGTAGEISNLPNGLLVEPGEHVVELVRPGFETERRPITVPAGDQVDIDLSLQEH